MRIALSTGRLAHKDLGGFRLPVVEVHDGWKQPDDEDDHTYVGMKVGPLSDMFRRTGKDVIAESMTFERFFSEFTEQGRCLAERPDKDHGRMWCVLDKGHTGVHAPMCYECFIVKMVMYEAATRAGQWQER